MAALLLAGCGASQIRGTPGASLPPLDENALRGDASQSYVLDTASGAIAEYTIPPIDDPRFKAYPIGIASGPDGAVWFAERGWGRLGRIKTNGKVTDQFSLKVKGRDVSRFPQNVAVGPDGNLWATCGTVRTYRKQSHNSPDPYGSIRQMSPSGTVLNIVHLPTKFSDPRGIASGPDGNLWFAERRGAIGELSPTGGTSGGPTLKDEFAIQNGNPVYPIVLGPDRNLWFGETFNATIGRITPKGRIAYFGLLKNHGPASIATGPDGYLYLTELYAGKVAQFSTSGKVTYEWSLPKGSSPKGIAFGSDGNLYVAEFGISSIAQITLTGSKNVNQFPTPTPKSGPWGITSGSDGNIWFTESLVGKIGRLTI